jgi:hypothetical protein
MDPGIRSPLIDFFRRGEVATDVRQLAASGGFAPTVLDQVALLLILMDDADPRIAETATRTIDALPRDAVSRFLTRREVPEQMRAFFVGRGIEPSGPVEAEPPLPAAEEPLVPEQEADKVDADTPNEPQVLANLSIMQRMKLAMKGTKEHRAQLIRDSNKLVSMAVLSSPKITESEIETYAKMANLTEDVLRVIGTNRAWTKNYNVIAGLAKNPKTPPALSMTFLQRLNEKDLKALTTDRNAPEAVRLAAKKYVRQK